MRTQLSTETIVLIAICLADMLTTLVLVMRGVATEQNPIMAACMNHSPGTFVVVKILSFVPFVIAVELYRRKNPSFARSACRCAIVLYLLAFAVLTYSTNRV